MSAVKDIELAWQAGIVDGEGTVTIVRQRRESHWPIFRPVIIVANTNPDIVYPFEDCWGGNIRKRKDYKDRNCKPCYMWHCSDSIVPEFLEAIYPYLRGKKKMVPLVLEFLSHRKAYKPHSLGRGKGSAPISDEEFEYREMMWCKVRALNRKGVKDGAG